MTNMIIKNECLKYYIAPSFREIQLCVKHKYDKLYLVTVKARQLIESYRFLPHSNSVNCMTTKKTDSDKLCKEHHVIPTHFHN